MHIYVDASDGSGSKLHKWKKSLQAEAKAAYDAHVASGVALDSKSRSLGVRGNGVSYWVHDMYLNNATASTTPDMCGGRMPATSFALALSPEHSKCEHDPMGGGSTRNVGCNHDNMFIEYYNTPDCTGEPYHYDHPMKTCEYDYESNKYIFNRCQVKYPFKDQAGALFT